MATETQRPAVRAPVAGPCPGMRLGRYELLRQLAMGGMAVVWIARQRGPFGFRRNVALKTIRPEYAADVGFRRMFLDEARLASLVRHANVAEVLDLGEEGGVVYQAIELVEGPTLKRLIEAHGATYGGGLPVPIAARVVADTLRGLHAAHELRDEKGVPLYLVHRDVSPHNILVGSDGLAKISDFGIAKALGRVADETDVGSVKGKYGYMAPEQVRRAPLDRRCDVFSAGIVLWEALTGERLFQGRDVLETAERVLTLSIGDLHELVPSVPKSLAAVVSKALAREPNDRHESAEAMADAIEEAVPLATGKQIAAFTAEFARAEVRMLRDALGQQSATAEDASTVSAIPQRAAEKPAAKAQTAVAPSASPRRRWPLALIPIPIVGVIAFVAAARPRHDTPDVGATAPTQSASTAQPSASAVEPLESATPASASISPSAHRPPPPPARPTQRPRATTSSPRPSSAETDPRFRNPYGQ